MAKLDLALTPRAEETRDEKIQRVPVQFGLDEIRKHFTDSIAELRKQFEVADRLLSEKDEEGCKTIWRSQVVLSEGLLDFYIHEMSKYCLFRMFTGEWKKSEKYDSFMIPMSQVEKALDAAESNDWFFDYLNTRFSREVFLANEHMKDQLNLIGIAYSDVMNEAFGELSTGRNKIVAMFQRRNAIAHQNDRSHASAEQEDITREYVEQYFKDVESVVTAIHKIAENTDNAQ